MMLLRDYVSSSSLSGHCLHPGNVLLASHCNNARHRVCVALCADGSDAASDSDDGPDLLGLGYASEDAKDSDGAAVPEAAPEAAAEADEDLADQAAEQVLPDDAVNAAATQSPAHRPAEHPDSFSRPAPMATADEGRGDSPAAKILDSFQKGDRCEVLVQMDPEILQNPAYACLCPMAAAADWVAAVLSSHEQMKVIGGCFIQVTKQSS